MNAATPLHLPLAPFATDPQDGYAATAPDYIGMAAKLRSALDSLTDEVMSRDFQDDHDLQAAVDKACAALDATQNHLRGIRP